MGAPTCGRSTASCLHLGQRRRPCRRPAQRRPPRAQVAGDGRRLQVRPHTCVYELSARRLVQHGRAHLDNASVRACTRHRRPRSCPASGQFREMPRCAATPPRQPKANGGDATALRDYLAAVYPAAAASVRDGAGAPPPSTAASTTFMLVATRRGSPRCARRCRAAAAACRRGRRTAAAVRPSRRLPRRARSSAGALPADASFERHASPIALLRAPLPLPTPAASLVARCQARPCALVDQPARPRAVPAITPAGLTHNGSKAALGGAKPCLRWATRRTTARGG